MEPSSIAISASPTNSNSMPTSATLAPHGRRAASKTPSAGYAETSPEKPTSTTCLPKPSTPSSKTTTTHPENASASLLQPKPSDRCTSNVNPHPDQVRGDAESKITLLLSNGVATDEWEDRKSTRLNSRSLMRTSYAVFCLKKK